MKKTSMKLFLDVNVLDEIDLDEKNLDDMGSMK
jgi:hypothetical protein